MSLSPTLFSRSGPLGLPPDPDPWTEKTIERSLFLSDVETWLDRQHSEFFLSGLQKLEQQAKKYIQFRGEYVE